MTRPLSPTEIGFVRRLATAGLGAGIVPAGVVLPYGGATAPAGWVLCDGSAVSRTAYPDLFTAIGTSYGVGDGSTTFNVPDLRGRMPVGKDGTTEFANLGTTGGEKTHALTSGELASHSHPIGGSTTGQSATHTHAVTDPGHTHLLEHTLIPNGASSAWTPTSNPLGNIKENTELSTTGITLGNASVDHTHPLPANTGSTGSGTAHQNLPPYLTLQFIIKA